MMAQPVQVHRRPFLKMIRMNGIVKHIPNTITSLNLLCGVLGILSCLRGDVPAAFFLMLSAAVFDFCDGLAARALHAYSDMGKELDSLADQVSFGVLPSVMAVCFAQASFESLGTAAMDVSPAVHWLVVCSPVAVAVFSGLRLAKFNVDERQSKDFIGLATPASAMLFASLVCFSMKSDSPLACRLSEWNVVRIAVPLISVSLAALLVCEIPMFGMKIKKGRNLAAGLYGKLRIAFFAGAAVIVAAVAALRLHFSLAFSLIFLYYIILNVAALPFSSGKGGVGKNGDGGN